MKCGTSGILPVSRREQNEVDDFSKSTSRLIATALIYIYIYIKKKFFFCFFFITSFQFLILVCQVN